MGGERRERDEDRRAHRARLDLEGRARCVHVHRMRALQGRVPDLSDRQAAVAEMGLRQPEAASAGAARRDRRRRRRTRCRRWLAKSSRRRRSGRARPAAIARRRARSSSSICRSFYRMRQHQVLMEGAFPHELKAVFDAYEVQSNPVGAAGRHARRTGRTGSASPSCERPKTCRPSTTCSTSARRSRSIRVRRRSRSRSSRSSSTPAYVRDPRRARDVDRRMRAPRRQRDAVPAARASAGRHAERTRRDAHRDLRSARASTR